MKLKFRVVGGVGVAVTSLSLLCILLTCSSFSPAQHLEKVLLMGLIIGFSLINSAALLELRARLDALEKPARRKTSK